MKRKRFLCLAAGFLLLPARGAPAAPDAVILLNVSCDATRAFYHDFNPLFAASWKHDTDQDVTVAITHDGSANAARAVLKGLDADVVTLDAVADLDLLAASQGPLLSPNWRTQFPHESVPFQSTVMFLVRAGNPKAIKDWDDLVKPGVRLVLSSPKTSGDGRCAYLAAWAYALQQPHGDETRAREFVRQMFRHVERLDTAGNDATLTFAQSQIGDVLLTFESEASRVLHDPGFAGDKLEPVTPSLTILAPLPVAIVNPNAAQHGTVPVAQAYLQFLYSPAAQELAAKRGFRPSDQDVLARHADQFKPVATVDVPAVFGGWEKAQQTHFKEGAIFDQIYQP